MDNQHDHGAYVTHFQNNKGSEIKVYLKNGNFQTIPYVHTIRTEFIVQVGIIMHFSFGRITLSGRNLANLAEKIGDRTIQAVREQHDFERNVPEDEPYIANILVEER